MAVEKLTFEMNAVGNAVPEMRKVQRQLGEVQKQTKRTGIAMNQFGGALTGVSKDTRKFAMGAMQQAGYQIGDFAVQVANGTSKMQAFGQQGSQLLGIFGPVGAVLGGLVAVGSAVAIAFDRMGSASSAANSAIKDIEEATRLARIELEMLAQGLMNVEQVQATKAMYSAMSEIAQVQEKIAALEDKRSDANKTRQAQIDRQIASYEREIGRQQEIVDNANAALEANRSINAELDAQREVSRDILGSSAGLKAAEEALNQLYESRLGTIDLTASKYVDVIGSEQGLAAAVAATNALYAARIGTIDDTANKYVDVLGSEDGLKSATEALNELYAKGLEDADKAAKKASRAIKTELTPEMKRAKAAGEAVGSSIENAMMGAVQGTMSVKDAFRSMAVDIIAELYRIFVIKKITGFISGAIEGALGGGVPAAPPSRPASFAGGGYTGNGARTGGLDGKGGFMAMLHPRETVVDHTQGQGTGGVVINQTINVSTGVQQTVRSEIKSLMPQIAESAKAAVVDAKRRGGSYGRSFA